MSDRIYVETVDGSPGYDCEEGCLLVCDLCDCFKSLDSDWVLVGKTEKIRNWDGMWGESGYKKEVRVEVWNVGLKIVASFEFEDGCLLLLDESMRFACPNGEDVHVFM